MPSFLSAEEELLIFNTILIVISAISPMTSVRFTSLSLIPECPLSLQFSFIFCECLGWQNSAVKTFNV